MEQGFCENAHRLEDGAIVVYTCGDHAGLDHEATYCVPEVHI